MTEQDKLLFFFYNRVSIIMQPLGQAVKIEIIDDDGLGHSFTYPEDEDGERSRFEVFKDAVKELMEKYPSD